MQKHCREAFLPSVPYVVASRHENTEVAISMQDTSLLH